MKKATAYKRAARPEKSRIWNDLVELTGWRRDYARAALREAGVVQVHPPRTPRAAQFDPHLIACLITCWTLTRTRLASAWPPSCR
jgi:hypothetical protein